MPTDTKLNQLIINQLTQEQYDEAKAAGTLSDTELYITDSDDDPQVKSNLSQTIDDSTTKYPSNKAVKDESSRIITLMDNKVSNCITEIPQDIKLELNNGTLTLKAGSKVYIPNGFESDGTTKKFNVVVIKNDVTADIKSDSGLFCYNKNNGTFSVLTNAVSGSSLDNPSYLQGWYDTTNNIIKRYLNIGGVSWQTNFSLPLCIVTSNTEKITSIGQVFNGFGYIGSTVYALPGVKGLIPNGRNADGSLKSTEFTLDKVFIFTVPPEYGNPTYFGIGNDFPRQAHYVGEKISADTIKALGNVMIYDDESNKVIATGDGGKTFYTQRAFYAFEITHNNGKVSSLTPKTVFHALDYNDKSTISGWSMPSSRYIDLTLGASGATYTAPANGWFSWYCYQNNNGYIFVQSSASLLANRVVNGSHDIAGFLPVRKGDVVMVEYANLTFNRLRFIYAEGEPYNPVSSSSKNHGYNTGVIPTHDQNDYGGGA